MRNKNYPFRFISKRIRPFAVTCVMVLLCTASMAQADPSPYAAEVVDYNGTLGNSPYDDPQSLLGSPARNFYDPWGSWSGGTNDRIVKLVEPAYNLESENGSKLITTLNNGAWITVKFDHLVLDDPNNPFGIDFLVFGNPFYTGDGSVNNSTDMNTYNLTGGGFFEDVTVAVSQDGISWYSYDSGPYADNAFPTNAYLWDDANAVWTNFPSDYTKPVDPSLETSLSAGGITAAYAIAAYDGSGGGTGFDLSESGYDWIQYVRVTSSGGEVDAFSDVASATTNIIPVSFDAIDPDGDMPAGQTDDRIITINVNAQGATEMKVWEEAPAESPVNRKDATWQSYVSTVNLTLSAEAGEKTVKICFRDESGNETGTVTKKIELQVPTAVDDWMIY